MSPTILRKSGYRFFFFSREESRLHIHVQSGGGEAKFWLLPEIELAKNYEFTRKQLKQIENIIEEYSNEIRDAWNSYFGS